MGSENESSSSLHVVMFPWFAFGHINPFVHLSNNLSSQGVQISFLSAPGNIPKISSSLQPGSNINIIPLEIPTVEGLPPGLDSTADMSPPLAELLKKALDLMQPQIKSLLINLKPQIVFFDFAQPWLPSIASELGIKTIYYSIFAAISAAYLTVPDRLIKSEPSEPTTVPSIDELKKPPIGFPPTSITTSKTYIAKDFQYVFRSFHGAACVYDRVVGCMNACDAIVMKSCNEMEAPYIDFLKTQYKKPVLLAGPIVPEPPVEDLDEKWVKWLSKFPSKSVVFASCGSETYLQDNAIKELVIGLELTGLPFFVALNFPAGEEKSRLKSALPEGFEERVKDKGIIHTGWLQQRQILAHDSVGCFVCHSGLSSVIEGLMNDCQLVLLPLKGDQFLNYKLISGDMKAGVEVNREDEDGYFGREDVCEAVKKVMVDVDEEPGKSIRANKKKWKEFLLDKEVQKKFITDFVLDLKKLVA